MTEFGHINGKYRYRADLVSDNSTDLFIKGIEILLNVCFMLECIFLFVPFSVSCAFLLPFICVQIALNCYSIGFG